MRGQLVTVALQGDFWKPRPVLIIQSDLFSNHSSVTIIPFTSELIDAPLFRFTIEPSKENGLLKKSQLMIDKVHTVLREKIGNVFGKISSAELLEVERLVTVFLGMA